MTTSLKFSVVALLALLVADVNLAVAASPNFVLSAVRTGPGIGASLDQFDSAGNILRQIPINGFPSDVTMDRFGNTYVSLTPPPYSNWQVNKYGPVGEFLGTIVPSSGNLLVGLGIDTLDRLYVGYNSNTDTIRRFELNGAPLGVFATVSTPSPGAPFALEFDSAGRLYVPDSYDVERFDANGGSLGVFATVPNAGDTFVDDLAFDSVGTLYAATLDSKIYKFDAAGAQIGVLNLPTSDGGTLDIDRDDTLYVGRSGDDAAIVKYTTTGAPIGVFAAGQPGVYFDLAIFDPIPEPTSALLCLLAALTVSGTRKRHRGDGGRRR